MATVADQLRVYLVAQGLVREPNTAGPLPPAWVQPVHGVNAPGEGSGVQVGPTIVVALDRSGGLARPRFEKEWRRDIVDIWLRTKTWPQAEEMYTNLSNALIDKVNWMMGSMRVIESLEWRPLQLLDRDPAQGYTSQHAVVFQTYSAEHF